MNLILSVETSTTVCSVAIVRDGEAILAEKLFIEKSHSSMLTLVIEALCKRGGYELGDFDAFAVSKGPGSYTGLRIGVSTIKGLCFALDKPLIAINTLKAMAYEVSQFNMENHCLCPMIDARRMEVYTALFDPQLNELEPISAKILDESSFRETLSTSSVLFFGNGSDKFMEIMKEQNAKFISGVSPSASAVGELAFLSFQKGEFEDVAYFEPYYLKDFIATVPKKLL